MSKIITVDFTKSFIGELTSYIVREYVDRGRPLGELTIVFGGQRPAHFLKRELARRLGKALVPPRFLTIDELMNTLANESGALRPLTDVEERYELYCLARELTPELLEGRDSFARFLPWAGEILGFIDELDLEDVNPKALENIEASARIGYPVPDNINRLLGRVLTLREAFHQRIISLGRTRRSLQYLRAKENVAGARLNVNEIIFANFFYFHRTEEKVARTFFERGQAVLFFQGDQRKWPVLERIARRFSCEIVEGAAPTPTQFNLSAYQAFDAHSQAAMARDILGGIKDHASTVVVLPDTTALMPLLSAFPSQWSGFNVSMGYPLKRGSLYALLQLILKAQLSRQDGAYYARDYLEVLRHPLAGHLRLKRAGADMRGEMERIDALLKGQSVGNISGQLFIRLEAVEAEPALARSLSVPEAEVGDAISRMHQILFRQWEGIDRLNDFAAALGKFLSEMAQFSDMDVYPLNLNIASRINEIKNSFERASFSGERFSFDEVVRVFEDIAEREMVSFSGTPLKGLQVLGLFETRSLDFENVIILDTNEGVLPRVQARSSLIPREVMSQLGLDRLELEEEIQRYQFMRVISSAKNVHIIYQQNKEKEPSRFLEELIWEQQMRQGELKPFPTRRVAFRSMVSSAKRQVAKTPAMLEFLRAFTYSASSVNAYLKNPYEFYTRYVLGLREQEDLLDEPDAALIGNFLHHFLEEAFRPFEGNRLVLDDDFETRFKGLFERHFKEQFTRRMRSDDFLVHRVMEHKLKAILDHERERTPQLARLIGVEKDYPARLSLSCGEFLFKTRVDRLEEHASGVITVLDYKTGSSDKLPMRPLVLSDEPDRQEIYDKVHSFQLPLYMYCISQAMPGRLVNAGLYLLRSAEIKYFFTERSPVVPVEKFLPPYLRALDIVMAEILDPDISFEDDDLSGFDI